MRLQRKLCLFLVVVLLLQSSVDASRKSTKKQRVSSQSSLRFSPSEYIGSVYFTCHTEILVVLISLGLFKYFTGSILTAVFLSVIFMSISSAGFYGYGQVESPRILKNKYKL